MKHPRLVIGRAVGMNGWRWTVLLVAVVALSIPPIPDAAAATASLTIEAPRAVRLGQPIVLRLVARNVADVAGYELTALFDRSAAEWNGLRQRANDVKKLKRDISPLGAVELPNGLAFGLYSCPVDDCVSRKGGKQGRGGRGTVQLAQLSLTPEQVGTLEIVFAAPKVVTASGAPVAVTLTNARVAVQVDAATPYRAAPSARWQLPAATAAGAAGPYDLTGDGQVTHADAAEVALAWTLARESSKPCAELADTTRDVNHDGCIDVADVQLVAANFSATGSASATAPARAADATQAVVAAQAGLTFTVDSPRDNPDAAIGDGICLTQYNYCSLRAAIQEANAHPGPDAIAFNIAATGVQTLQLASKLPAINDATGPTIIDGYTQPGSVPNTSQYASNAQIKIQIAGKGEAAFDGVSITSANNVVRGLAFYRLRRSIWLYGSGATDNYIVGNFVGTDAAGTYQAPTYNYDGPGIKVDQGAARNHIGDPQLADRNVVSGNAGHGMTFHTEATDYNLVRNNLIGLGPGGTSRLQNQKHGVDINRGASNNIIGGTNALERNIISGNGDGDLDDYTAGIEISHDTLTSQNKVIGNCLGTDVTCTTAPAWAYNSHYGIRMEDGVTNNVVSDNVIGNSRAGGIKIDGLLTGGNRITNNRIGASLNDTAIGNNDFGVYVSGQTMNNIIGPNNVIANNVRGIYMFGATTMQNTITQNQIYNNAQLGIDLGGDGVTPNDPGDGDSGPNAYLNIPELAVVTTVVVSGVSCAGCTIEVFIAERMLTDRGGGRYGQGKTFVGGGVAGGQGGFSVAISGVKVGDYVTATATDGTHNTSEFARNMVATQAPATPTPSSPPSAEFATFVPGVFR